MLYLCPLIQTGEGDNRKGRGEEKKELIIKVEQYLNKKKTVKLLGKKRCREKRGEKKMGCFIYLLLISCLPYS